MKTSIRLLTSFSLSVLLLSFVSSCSMFSKSTGSNDQAFWLTDPSQNILFEQKTIASVVDEQLVSSGQIKIDPTSTYQSMDGFGYCLTGGSVQLLNRMSTTARSAILHELFGTGDDEIGVSYLRVSIGASDLSDRVFSYNDLAEGEIDVTMEKFSLEPERADLIPVLKEILAINPEIKILGSPWSPPTWMKTNNSSKGGSLKPEFYDAYALYFVKYIQGMAAEGIRIDAITIQNEPLHPGNNPSLLMLPEEQALFIKQSLGPAFQREKIDTKIIIYDHNADRPDYPLTILNDPEAAQYVDGSAFHLYGGSIDALSTVHNAFPDKNLYFTEQWVGAPGNMAEDVLWHVSTLIIGGSRNWCRNVLEWNLAADPNNDPHTDGGCTKCLGAITIDGDLVSRNPAYYTIAHASKFVRPGSVRIASTFFDGINNVAFATPDGKVVLIVSNTSSEAKKFDVELNGKTVAAQLNAGAIGTFLFELK